MVAHLFSVVVNSLIVFFFTFRLYRSVLSCEGRGERGERWRERRKGGKMGRRKRGKAEKRKSRKAERRKAESGKAEKRKAERRNARKGQSWKEGQRVVTILYVDIR